MKKYRVTVTPELRTWGIEADGYTVEQGLLTFFREYSSNPREAIATFQQWTAVVAEDHGGTK